MNRTLLGGIAAVTLGGAALWVRLLRPEEAQKQPSHMQAAPQASDVAEELGRLRLEVARLSAELHGLAQATSVPQENVPAVPEHEPGPESEPHRREEPNEIRVRRAVQIERLAAVSTWLSTETRDESWAGPAEKHLDDVLRSDTFRGSQVLSSVCRSSLCRVEARHDGADSRDNFELLRREIDGNFVMQHVEPDEAGAGDGTLRTIAFFVRPGHEQENPLYDMMHAPRE